MELNVCWMYHDIMDLYGDKGNMMVLQKRCEERGISITIDTLSIGDQRDLRAYDLLFLGGGADKEQMMLIDDLLSRRENIREAMEQGTFVLLICGGYQLFGQYYISADNEKIEGLKFFDYYTTTGSNGTRCIGNIAIRCNLDGHEITAVGFENHGGQTCNVATPLGKVNIILGVIIHARRRYLSHCHSKGGCHATSFHNEGTKTRRNEKLRALCLLTHSAGFSIC